MQAVTKIFIIVLITWLTAEVLKIIWDLIVHKRFRADYLLHYGGMPSSHSTFVTSMVLSVGLIDGFTTSFLLALAIWMLVMRDLIVIRGHIDTNAENIKKIIKNKINIDRISHNLLQVTAGTILGVILPIILYFLF